MIKEYKIIDCERAHLKAVIESDEKLGWNLVCASNYETGISRDNYKYAMYTLFYSRVRDEKE